MRKTEERVFLGGDLMTGRGIDQSLPHPGDPALIEESIRDARGYLELAARAGAEVRAPVGFEVPWGDALEALERFAPAVRIANLETAVTRSSAFWPGKEVHYRMHPANAPVLTAARLDLVTLANNHALDFGREGLLETLDVLAAQGIGVVGAGRDDEEARRVVRRGRVLACGAATPDCGVPDAWAAGPGTPGVNMVELTDAAADAIAGSLRERKGPEDVAVVSLHWGSNWGFGVPPAHVRFARRLIDGGVDLVHGHSSHHVRPVEVHRGRLVLYGCGELLDDYEGIAGYEAYGGQLAPLYLARLAPGGELTSLELAPMRIRRMRLERASGRDAAWLAAKLAAIGEAHGTRVERAEDGRLALRWDR